MVAAGAFGGPKVDTAKIEAFFEIYKDPEGEGVSIAHQVVPPASFR